MGKSKRRDRPRRRQDPTTGRPPKPPADPETAALRDQKILPVIAALAGPEPKKRSEAAIAIANLIEDQKCRKLLLKEKIVGVVMEQTITDSNMEVVAAGWGVLRNLALEEGPDFGLHLYRQDILTPVEAAVQNVINMIESTQPALSSLPKPRQNLLWNLTESFLSILSSLSQVNQHITDTISYASVIPGFHFRLLHLPMAPDHVKQAALLCLRALMEDNDILTKAVVHRPEWLQRLSGLIDKPDLVGVAACGVLHEINSVLSVSGEDLPDGIPSDLLVLKSLDAQLDRHCSNAAPTVEDFDSHADAAEHEKELGLVLEFIASIAANTQTYLDAEPDLNKDESEGFADDDNMEDHVPEDSDGVIGNEINQDGTHDTSDGVEDGLDMELVTNGKHSNGDTQLSSSIQGNESVLGYLVNCTTPKLLALIGAPRDHPADSSLSCTPLDAIFSGPSSSIRNLSLTALNNIAWTVSTTTFPSNVRPQWHTRAQDIWTNIIYPVLTSNTADTELASSITSLAWAVSRSVNGQIALSGDEHEKFMALYQASTALHPQSINSSKPTTNHQDDPTGSLSVKCIGVLGSLALCPNRKTATSALSSSPSSTFPKHPPKTPSRR